MIWKAMKKEACRTAKAGTIGYAVAMLRAADLFLIVMSHLSKSARIREAQEFDADQELRDAIVQRGYLIAIGRLEK